MNKLLIKTCLVISLIFFASNCFLTQPDSDEINYFGLTPPGNQPKVFNPEFIADSSFVQNASFSSDGKDFYYVETDGNWSYSKLYCVSDINKITGEPKQLFPELPLCMVPFVNYQNDKIFFISSKSDSAISGDIFMATREANKWNKPIALDFPVNSEYEEWEVSVAKNGNLYFSSNRPGGFGEMDIYKSEYVNGKYSKIENLGRPINTKSLDECPFIAADESYMIFNSWKKSNRKGNNLYVSFNNSGKWTNPKSLGDNINSDQLDIYPYISPDGKYLFFTYRNKPFECSQPSNLYWVHTSFLDSLRNTNYAPYVNIEIPDTTFKVGEKISLQIAAETFYDDDKNDRLSYSATLDDGNKLPVWLKFIPESLLFSGTPTKKDKLKIKVSALDDNKAEANSTFELIISGNN